MSESDSEGVPIVKPWREVISEMLEAMPKDYPSISLMSPVHEGAPVDIVLIVCSRASGPPVKGASLDDEIKKKLLLTAQSMLSTVEVSYFSDEPKKVDYPPCYLEVTIIGDHVEIKTSPREEKK